MRLRLLVLEKDKLICENAVMNGRSLLQWHRLTQGQGTGYMVFTSAQAQAQCLMFHWPLIEWSKSGRAKDLNPTSVDLGIL